MAIPASQRAYFESGQTRPVEARRAALRRLRSAIVAEESAILGALRHDLRRPGYEAYAAEIALVIAEIDFVLRHLHRWSRPTRRPAPRLAWPARSWVMPGPLGVCLIIGPWNYPFQLSLLPLIGAIAAGNCAIVKPSETCPQSGEVLTRIIESAFESAQVACVLGGPEIAEALLALRFDKIFYTGSATVGRIVAAAAAAHLTPVTLELGGKCPVVVNADANLPLAARRIVWAKTLNAGQICVAPDYLLVHRSVEADLIEQLKCASRSMFGPDPQQSPYYSRIVNRKHFDRLVGMLPGGRVVWGGQSDAEDLFIAPTLLDRVASSSPLLTEEIFGPLLPIVAFDEVSEAVKLIRNNPDPLACYVFTQRREAAEHLRAHIRCGSFCINDLMVQIMGRHLPFGGVGESGMGAYHGKASFDCFSHFQTVVRASARLDLPMRYPPPPISLKVLKRVIPWLLRK